MVGQIIYVCRFAHHLHGGLVIIFETALVRERVQQTGFAHRAVAHNHQMLGRVRHDVDGIAVVVVVTVRGVCARALVARCCRACCGR